MPLLQRDLRRFRALQQELREYFRPFSTIEEDLVDRIAMARWHLSQAERLLQGFWDLAETPDLPEPARLTERHRCRRLARYLAGDCDGKNVLSRILRYKESARRDMLAFQKTLFQLREPDCETKPKPDSVDPLTNPFYRQDLYRILDRRPRKLPSAYEDPSLTRPPSSGPGGPNLPVTRHPSE